MASATDTQAAIRAAAFSWLHEQVQRYGDVLPYNTLAQGFQYQQQRVPLLGPQGIFKPRVLQLPLSITTVPSGPYDDGYTSDGRLLYRYRGADPHHRDNRGLRTVMQERIPLVYFYRVVKGKYLAVWPVFVVGDDPARLVFTIEVEDAYYAGMSSGATMSGLHVGEVPGEDRRAYITATVRQRVHQRRFRELVLQAYRKQCALCRLRHVELLDASHIVPDTEPDGKPVIANGLALCKLHHAAFDRHFLGVRPDYCIEVRRDILEESDGPMLQHGLKGLHGQSIALPKAKSDRPAPALLEQRYQRFLSAGHGAS